MSKVLVVILIVVGILGIVHTVKKHPENSTIGLITLYRGIEIFFHTRQDVSFKAYDCRKISSANFSEQLNWEPAEEHSKDSIVAYGEDYFEIYFENDTHNGYEVLKREPLTGRITGTEGFSYLCKGRDGSEAEIIFEKNVLQNSIKILIASINNYVYEYKVKPVFE